MLIGEIVIAGFNENIEVYHGDLNGDLRTDFFIKQRDLVILHGDIATPISAKSTVEDFALIQNANGDFVIQSALSTGELSSVNSWPKSSVVTYVEDINVDGVYDVMIKETSSITPLANDNLGDDQIVFGPTVTGLSPTVIRGVDIELSDFLTDLTVYQVRGPTYYFNSSTFVGNQCVAGYYYPITIPVWDAYLQQYRNVIVGWTLVCTSAVAVYDLEGFNQDAIDVATKAAEVYEGIRSMSDIVEIFEQVFGIEIGIPGTPSCTDSAVDFADPQDCEDNETLIKVVSRFGRSEEILVSGPQPVEFRARLLAFGRGGFYHASVHYLEGWYSGFAGNGFVQALLGNGGNLVKRASDPSDVRRDTLLAATATSGSVSPSTLWQLIGVSYLGYDENLNYCFFPELGLAGQRMPSEWPNGIDPEQTTYVPCDGYNSNSFSKGLVDSVGATLTPVVHHVGRHGRTLPFDWEFDIATFNDFPGITKPVPTSEFQ